jgi:DNA gyrase subunit A
VKDEDFIDKLFVANTHDTILCFSSRGKMYWLKVYRVPQASRGSRGKPIVNLLPLEEGERINAILPIREFDADSFVFMATSNGTVKKTPLSLFSRPRSSGIIAIDLRNGDKLVDVAITDGRQEIMLVASHGKAIRFADKDVRAMGRGAAGVRGIKLPTGHEVIALTIVGEGMLLSATENGFGKRTEITEFPVQGRGGQGVIAIQTTERNGRTVGAIQVRDEDEVMLISSSGTLVRTPVSDISIIGRNTQGVTLIRVESGQRLVGLARIESIEDVDE